MSDLPTTGTLAELDDEVKTAMAAMMRVEEHPVGTPLVIEGDAPTKFYVLLDGHVTVHRAGSHVQDLGPGEVIGELGVISMRPRKATVIATTDVKVAVAMGWDLRQAIDEQPALRARLDELAAQRGG
ncbi:MAG: cyclic nucleotide-binding domain-containing protein [Ilumatobacter sp.]|nr:cyclic nucleotide-binding domain-containing protein [Ilumatobacter sp.]